MSSYSPALEYFCQRLEGLSTGIFRLEAQNQTSNIAPQAIIRFTLPSNALVDMHSFGLHFNAQTSNGGATSGTVAVRLPNRIESMINRVEVSIGGVAVSSGANFYNVLCHAKDVVDGYRDDAGCNHPELQTTHLVAAGNSNNNYVDGVALIAANQNGGEQPVSTNNEAQFCVNEWLGFIGECEPRVLDTSLMGDIVITIYLEQANLCITSCDAPTKAGFVTSAALAGQAAVSYTLNNVYATVRCYSLASGVYDNMIAEQMQKSGALEIGFKQYFSFRDNNTGSTRWTVATQSLDRVLVAHHADVQAANPAPVRCAGYNSINDITSVATLASSSVASRPLNLGKTKYIIPYVNFQEPAAAGAGLCLYEWQLNGAKYPQFRASPEDVYNIMRMASKFERKWDEEGLFQYRTNKFVSAIKLTLDAPNARFIQGLDTRSVSLNGYYYIYNQAGNTDISLFAECTSSLLVSAGRQIELVQ